MVYRRASGLSGTFFFSKCVRRGKCQGRCLEFGIREAWVIDAPWYEQFVITHIPFTRVVKLACPARRLSMANWPIGDGQVSSHHGG